ncbi:MAG: hypothetical protein IJ106_03240 [Parasporobacterium sp.]|nr:hypothetical protein [Parasporobacterium sp.]
MRTGSGKRSGYNRTTGSRTGRLYSRRTAKKINKIFLDEESKVIRTESYYGNPAGRSRNYESATYDDYYDNLPAKKNKKGKMGVAATIVAASLIVVILALVLVGLALLKPQSEARIDLAAVNFSTQTASALEGSPGDSAAPVIYGVMPIVVYSGHSVAYKDGIYLSDDNDSNPNLEIDNSQVDLTVPGVYPVTYIARDRDGNVTEELTTVTVLEGTELISEEEINQLADRVLEAIIPDDTISDEMKCLKVYEYLHAIGYVDEVHSPDWLQNAYWMLTKREGDCFCYYSVARLLLTRLGYEVMEVRNNNNYVHYWCLVSIDKGATWWHFDACCWSWGEDGILCLVSDRYLAEFTRRHMTSDGRLIHAWDMTLYPSTPAEDFWTDEDRAVIYEDGLIDVDVSHDPNDERWENDGWENYQVPYYLPADENIYNYSAESTAAYGEQVPDPQADAYDPYNGQTDPAAEDGIYYQDGTYDPYGTDQPDETYVPEETYAPEDSYYEEPLTEDVYYTEDPAADWDGDTYYEDPYAGEPAVSDEYTESYIEPITDQVFDDSVVIVEDGAY